MTLKMTYAPAKDVDDFEPGDWKWLGGLEHERVGIIYMLPTGDLAAALDNIPANEGHHGARWTITGDESTGLTLHPSILHKAGQPGEWHGWIRDGELVAC